MIIIVMTITHESRVFSLQSFQILYYQYQIQNSHNIR